MPRQFKPTKKLVQPARDLMPDRMFETRSDAWAAVGLSVDYSTKAVKRAQREAILLIPLFIAIALVLVVVQPRLKRVLADREIHAVHENGIVVALAVYLTGVYGGYFGAAQGILLLAILNLALDDELQRLNALKVVLAGLVNLVAGIVFVCVAHIAWLPAALIAAGSLLGGVLGARYGRRLPPAALRGVILIVGVVAIVRLVA